MPIVRGGGAVGGRGGVECTASIAMFCFELEREKKPFAFTRADIN